MSEHKKIGNPFDEANFVGGGGLWDGKTVTILTARAVLDPMTYADGTPVIGERDGKPVIKHSLAITGIADEDEAERRESYSAGSLVPTADGDGFIKADGTPSGFHKGSEMAHFSKCIKDAGFEPRRVDSSYSMKVRGQSL